VTKVRLRFVMAFTGLVGAASVQFALGEPVPDAVLPEELTGERCVAHEMNIPVQELHLSGTELHLSGTRGGLNIGPVTYRDRTGGSGIVTLQRLTVGEALDMAGTPADRPFFHGHQMQGDVIIVVADDFAGEVYTLPPLFEVPQVNSLTLDDIEQEITSGSLSHGALVMHHLNVAIASLHLGDPSQPMFLKDVTQSAPERTVWVHQVSGSKLVVAALDLHKVANSQVITVDHVWKALSDEVAQVVREAFPTHDPDGVVVNMSWVFLPCGTVQAFIKAKFAYEDFPTYLEDIGVDLDAYALEDVLARLAEVDNGILLSFIDGGRIPKIFNSDRAALVAAAGNFSMSYQMLPAGWQRVVGVAVEEVARPVPFRYSNIGDLTVPGESFVFETLNDDGSLGVQTQVSYGGTSFVAPLVSLYAALDISSGMPFCTDKYSPPDLTHLGLTAGMLDVPLATAVDNCPHP
jgi:hypothetical protein